MPALDIAALVMINHRDSRRRQTAGPCQSCHAGPTVRKYIRSSLLHTLLWLQVHWRSGEAHPKAALSGSTSL